MELRKGYKQTEVGLIPNDWDVLVLKHVLIGIADVDHYMPQTSKIGIPYIMTGDLKELVSEIDLDNCKQISTSDYKLLSKKIKNLKGDVILARYATIGTVSYVDINFDFVVSYSCVTIKPNPSKLLGVFLFNYFKSIAFKLEVSNIINANTQANVGIGDLYTMKIALPPLTEQTAIATALSDADALISSLEKLIEKKQNIKQGAMQELLKPKKGWVVKKLGEVAVFYKGKGLPKSEISEYGRYKCIHYGELFTKYKELINEIYSYTDNNLLSFLSNANDVLMPTSDVTPNGLAKASCIKENNIILGGDVLVIRTPEAIVDGVFLSYCITSDKEQVMSLVSGSTVFHLYGSDMKKFEINLPPNIEEQNTIATVLTEMSNEILALEKKLSKCKMLKQGMMQELLTGKIRLI